MIRLESVSKAYAKSKVKAVDNLTLSVERGQLFGFIGPNGAGKTTTIKMLCGILRPDEGSVTVNGINMLENPTAAKRQIGYVPDSHDIYDMLTGREYLNFLADIYEVGPERAQRMGHYLEMFELAGAADQPIKSFSHGMKQKLVLTGALLHRPAVWVLDEPLVGLDPKSSLLLKDEMRAHCRAGNCVFFSTHILEVAEKLCDQIGIIYKGKLISKGTMEEVKKGGSLESVFMELTDVSAGGKQ